MEVCAKSATPRGTLLSESKSAPARRGSVQTTTRRRALWTLDAGSHRARGGAPPGTLDPAMSPKKKGNGDDEAEACPADMDPEVWAVVKDVNQLVALASKKTSAPPVTRFDALLHLWSAAASNPRERDALVAAGALAASLAASKPDVPFLDRGAGLGLTRALTVGDERTSISSAAHIEAASEARVAASALDALLRGSSTSIRCVADALAILLGLARHASTRQRTIATIAASGAPAWIALADALTLDERHETVAAADASRDAASLMSLCARFGDASADADAAAVDAAGSAIASVLATRTNALEHLLDAVCGAESEFITKGKKREDGDEGEDEDDEDERSVTSGAEPPPAHLSALALERSRSIQLRRADKRLAAAECLASCSRSDDAGDWLFRGFQTPRVARLVRFMRRVFVLRNETNHTSENEDDARHERFVTEVIEEEPFRNAAATALFNAVDRGACARADLALRRALAEDAALRAEADVSEEAEETDGEKNKKKPTRISNPPLDLRREKLPGGFGQAARRSLADRRSATAGADAAGADAAFASRSGVAKMERARALCDAGGVAPLVALLEKPKKGREGVTDGSARSRVSGESSEKEKKSPEEKRREALRASATLEGRRSAAGLTRYLTALDARTTSLVIGAGGVRAAVAALADADDDTRRHAQAALWNVANIEMEETNDAGDGEEAEAEAKKKVAKATRENETAVPRAHAEALRDANAPGYVSKVMAYGDQLEKLALRDASDNRCPDRPDASKS